MRHIANTHEQVISFLSDRLSNALSQLDILNAMFLCEEFLRIETQYNNFNIVTIICYILKMKQ